MSAVISRKLLDLITVLTLFVYFVVGECLFEKDFGYKLLDGVFHCETVCLDNIDKCVANNVNFIRENVCEMFSALPPICSAKHLLPNARGKSII